MKITYTDTMHVVDKTLTNGIMTHDNQSQILSIVFFGVNGKTWMMV